MFVKRCLSEEVLHVNSLGHLYETTVPVFYLYNFSENECVGIIAWYYINDEIWITNLYVPDAHRGKGIGTNLVDEVVKTFPSMPIKLFVYKDNEVAIKLYKKFHFEPEEDYQDIIVMMRH